MSGAQDLTLGFVPLNDAAPLIVALERGLFAAEGLNVRLSREVSWATVRDKVSAGALDGAHLLAPVTLASTLGLGGDARPMIAPMALNRCGAAITLSHRLTERFRPGEPMAKALARVLAERRATGQGAPTFAVVFAYSMHNYLLRYWLAAAGIDPERDVRITVVPPSRTAAKLAAGELDGFCAGEPWNAVAEDQGVATVAARAFDIWRQGPEKVFGVTADWAQANAGALQACLRALLRAAAWAENPENRVELSSLLARPHYVGASADSIARSLPTTRFHGDKANAPLPVQAGWLLSQMIRWGQAPADLDVAEVAGRVFRLDLYNEAAAALGWPAASASDLAEGFADGGVFRLSQASAYAAAFPIGRLRPA